MSARESLNLKFWRDDEMYCGVIIHTIVKQPSQCRVPVGFQTAREFSLASPTRRRHHRSPEVADDHLSPLGDKLLADVPPNLRVRPCVLGAPASVDAAIGAMLFDKLILVHGRCGDEDDPRIVREDQWVREYGGEVLTVCL